nr:LOW QUALITY PROTEIN: E3 ubiquitin-protein ligase TM129 [Hydra vulgaris]
MDLYFSFVFLVVALCFVSPPKEFISIGFTVQNIFSSYLGSEAVDFVGYHMKRTTLTILVHSLIPLVYYISLGFLSPELHLFSFLNLSPWVQFFFLVSFSCALIGVVLFFVWTYPTSNYHPLARDLVKFGTPWRSVASQINLEFRHIEKFSLLSGGTSIYVTNSWIIKCTAYKIYIAKQTDSHLTIVKTENFSYNIGQVSSGQFLQIKVSTILPHEECFFINLNSLDYNDLKDRLSAPIRNARDIVIHQTLSDCFIEAFKEQVEANGPLNNYVFRNDEQESCIGCMAKEPNIKLSRHCNSISENECQQCYCRPMWCLECMGRWFGSRQDQNQPELWMSSNAPCPTCRMKFCMLDVFKVK